MYGVMRYSNHLPLFPAIAPPVSVGAIVGGVIGGLVLISLLILAGIVIFAVVRWSLSRRGIYTRTAR